MEHLRGYKKKKQKKKNGGNFYQSCPSLSEILIASLVKSYIKFKISFPNKDFVS